MAAGQERALICGAAMTIIIRERKCPPPQKTKFLDKTMVMN
jgi:hypothetical protein